MGIQKTCSAVLFLMLVLLLGCGSSGDDNPGATKNKTELSGQFIDSAVSGLRYVTSGGIEGVTDTKGTFKYNKGETVKFFIGDILIGQGTGAPLITPVGLVSGAADQTNQTVLNIARFLQSLDIDQTPANGISISMEVLNAATGQSLNFTSAMFETEAAALVTMLRTNAYGDDVNGLVSDASAAQHLQGTLLSARAGVYAGTYTQQPADDAGNWVFNIDQDGVIRGCGQSSVYPGDMFDITGDLSSNGSMEMIAGTTTSGATFTGMVNLDGTVSGTWSNSTAGSGGVYAGSRVPVNVPVTNCSNSSNPPVVVIPNKLAISGDDTAIIGTSFEPTEATVGADYMRWRQFDSTPAISHSLLVTLAADGTITQITYGRIIGTDEYVYTASCDTADCSNIHISQFITFAGMILPPDASGGLATAPIELSGSLTIGTAQGG